MRVLYVTYHPNALSESYVRTEIEWMQGQGVDVHLLSKSWHPEEVSGYHSSVSDITINQPLSSTAARVKPDIIHAHCMYTITRSYEHEMRRGIGVPTTIRGHSFDFQPALAMSLASISDVKRIWLFPHFAVECEHDKKISPLPSCFPSYYRPGVQKTPPRVVRVMAGLASKKIDAWLEIARLCPEIEFVLAMAAPMPPQDKYPHEVAQRLPANVKMHINLNHREVQRLVSESSISLTTLPEHPFGMPVSLAEAMACGLAIVAPDLKASRDYLGAAGHYYTTPGEAAELIKRLVIVARGKSNESTYEWFDIRSASVNAAQKYRADVVLPEILNTWRDLAELRR